MWFYKRGKCGSYLVLAIALIFGRQTVIFFGRETFLSVKVGWHGENLKSLSTLELHFTATTGIKHGVLGWNPTSVTMVTTAMCEKMCERIWECVRESYSSILLTYEWVHKHNFSGKIARPFELTNLTTLMEREDRITFTFHSVFLYNNMKRFCSGIWWRNTWANPTFLRHRSLQETKEQDPSEGEDNFFKKNWIVCFKINVFSFIWSFVIEPTRHSQSVTDEQCGQIGQFIALWGAWVNIYFAQIAHIFWQFL